VIQLDEEVEGMQSTILTLQQQIKSVKNELVEEKQSSEKHVEQIHILERNLDLARTQPPSPVEGGKPPTLEDMQCSNTDRTEAEIPESGHEAMETECSIAQEPGQDNMKHEEKDSSTLQNAVEPELENMKPDGENVFSQDKNVLSEEKNVLLVAENVQPDVNSVLEVRDPSVINDACANNSVVEGAHDDGEKTKTIESTEDLPSRTIENANPFPSSLEPNLRKSAGTPPCSTTFSISQILGEPKRTPSPDISPGGDAVVTKIPYIGGYSDSTGDALRTEGSGLQNGEGKDTTPPLLT
jgi:hypothetical protein